MSSGAAEVAQGRVEPAIASEFPELRLRYVEVEGGSGRSPRSVKRRLVALSDRFGGRQALVFRNRPLPFAYRVFFRHIGIDPDEQPTPLEAIVRDRLLHGGFLSRGLLDDALAIAMIETSVALVAFDAAAVEGQLGLRLAHEGERLAGSGFGLREGSLVIADDARPLAQLFGDVAEDCRVGRRTERTLIAAIAVAGVSEPAVEEALWIAADVLVA